MSVTGSSRGHRLRKSPIRDSVSSKSGFLCPSCRMSLTASKSARSSQRHNLIFGDYSRRAPRFLGDTGATMKWLALFLLVLPLSAHAQSIPPLAEPPQHVRNQDQVARFNQILAHPQDSDATAWEWYTFTDDTGWRAG